MTRRAWVAWAAALSVLALAWQGARPLWEPDEGRYVAVALEMLDSGDWLVPRLHPDVEHLTKPPVTYWAVAGSMAALGRTELAARMPNAIAFAVTTLLVVVAARRAGERAPVAAGVVYATSLGPYVASNVVTPDTLLTLWTTASLAAVIAAWSAPTDRSARWWATAAWAAAGLAFLTKGPPGLLVPAAAATAIAAVGGRTSARRLATPVGVILFVVLAFGWYAALANDRPGLLARLVREEVVGRIATDHHRRSPEWWRIVTVYLPTAALALSPWLLVAGGRLARLGDAVRPSAWRRWRSERPSTVILAAAVAAPLAVLLVARSRQPLYMLPLLPPAAVLLARAVPWPPTRRLAAVLVCWTLVLLGLRAAAPWVPTSRSARDLAVAVRELVPGPIDEVVVVNDVNRFGLAFELGCDVEHVALATADLEPHVGYRRRLLEDEVGLPHGRRVHLVPAHSLDRYRLEAARLGVGFSQVGRIGKMFVFAGEPGARRG